MPDAPTSTTEKASSIRAEKHATPHRVRVIHPQPEAAIITRGPPLSLNPGAGDLMAQIGLQAGVIAPICLKAPVETGIPAQTALAGRE